MKLQDKLEDKIYNTISSSTKRNIELIIMHPHTWYNLSKEAFEKENTAINRFKEELTYRGIKVFRSYDMKENEFEVILK